MGEITDSDTFAEIYHDGSRVEGDVYMDAIYFGNEQLGSQLAGYAKFGLVKYAHPMWLSRLGVDGVLGLSMQRDAIQGHHSMNNILVGMFLDEPSRPITFTIDISQGSVDKPIGRLIFRVHTGSEWIHVDDRGHGHWALKLRQIKWKFAAQGQEEEGQQLHFDFNAPLILDIGTRYSYFNNKFLGTIHPSVSGIHSTHGWDIPMVAPLPTEIELVIENPRAVNKSLTSIFLPGSVLRRPRMNNNLGLAMFQSSEDLPGLKSLGGGNEEGQEPCVLGSIALHYVKTCYKYDQVNHEQWVAVVPSSNNH